MHLLQQHFVKRFAEQYQKPIRGITRRAQILLSRYAWPGNIRELENVLGNACMMTDAQAIDVSDLPEYIRSRDSSAVEDKEVITTLAEVEKTYLLRVLGKLEGNKVRAAELLGISRAKLYRILNDVSVTEDVSSDPA